MNPTSIARLSLVALSPLLPAQFTLSELLVNPPGTDQGQESVEIQGAANAGLTGYYLLAIDGDGTNAGVVDQVVNLGTYTTGANGLLLIRDTAAVLSPAPDPATTVVVFDFNPDIENGTNTFVLGRGTPPAIAFDLDVNNDGTLDNGIPGFTTVDAVSISDAGASSRQYATQLGGYDVPATGQFTPDALYRVYDAAGVPFCWTVGDVVAASITGPYDFAFAAGNVQGGLAPGYGPQRLDLGSANGRLSLCTDVFGIGSLPGGLQRMRADAGTANAGKVYLFLGSLSGISPGIPVAPGVTVPLNVDGYLLVTLSITNTPILNPSVGVLDAQGRANCTFALPAGRGIAPGTKFNHAMIVVDLAQSTIPFATTPATVTVQ
jgi:hypothetical protein